MLSVLVFALFVLFRFLLSADSDAVAAGMASIVPEKVAIVHQPVPVLVTQAPTPPRPDWPPPQPRREETVNRAARGPTQLQRIRDVLAGEIAAQKVTVLEEGSSIIVLVGGQFDSASATVLDGFKPVVAKIAQSLAKEPGDILVTGHTDSVPIFTVRFPSNYELSRERAMAMAAILKSGISDPSRIKVEPKADTKPRYTNTTEEGRAGNRRVEISIPTEETLRKP